MREGIHCDNNPYLNVNVAKPHSQSGTLNLQQYVLQHYNKHMYAFFLTDIGIAKDIFKYF
jgi:hypothetical protein